jgi:imidazolonepropionase-like amidohydrolase
MKVILAILLLIGLGVPFQSRQLSSLVITHVTVIDMTGAPPQSDMTVVITGNHISAIGKTGKLRLPNGAQLINGRGRFLIPGLWDMHVHLTEVERSFPMFVANGVTGVRNMGGDLDQLLRWRAEISSGKLLGPRIVTCGPIVDGPEPAAHGSVVIARNSAEGRQQVDSLKQRGADCFKVYDRLPRDAYFAIVDEAKTKGLPVVGHAPLSITSEEASNAGQRSIEHLGNIFESASTLGAKLLEEESSTQPVKDPSEFPRRIAARGERMLNTYDEKRANAVFATFVKNQTWQVPTLETKWAQTFIDDIVQQTNPRLKYVPESERQWWTPQKNFFARYRTPEYIVYRKRLFQKELDLVGAMHRAGVPFMTGTDLSGAYVFAGFSIHHELEMFVRAGFTPLEALQAATRNPAAFLGESRSSGTVEIGRIANLVLLEASPLQDIRNTQKINAVILNGTYLSKEKLESLLAAAEAAAKKG